MEVTGAGQFPPQLKQWVSLHPDHEVITAVRLSGSSDCRTRQHHRFGGNDIHLNRNVPAGIHPLGNIKPVTSDLVRG